MIKGSLFEEVTLKLRVKKRGKQRPREEYLRGHISYPLLHNKLLQNLLALNSIHVLLMVSAGHESRHSFAGYL